MSASTGDTRLSRPALTLADSMGISQSWGSNVLIGRDKGIKCPSLNSELQAGREPGTSWCVPWGARGAVRHREVEARGAPQVGFGLLCDLGGSCYSWCSGYLVRGHGAVGECRGQGLVCFQAGGCLGAIARSTRAGHRVWSPGAVVRS